MKTANLLALSLLAAGFAGAQTPAPPSAKLSWTPPTTYADGTPIPSTVTLAYNVYQGTSATNLVKVASGVTAATQTITTGLADGQTYYWSVTAVANSLEGGQSAVVSKSFAAVAPGTVTLTVQ